MSPTDRFLATSSEEATRVGKRSGMRNWSAQKRAQAEQLADGSRYASAKTVEAVDFANFLRALLWSGDRVRGRTFWP